MSTETKIEGLAELLESLKEEVSTWELDSKSPAAASDDEIELIRRGLYLTAMDVLLAEMRRPGGYESYSKLPDRVLLPLDDYTPIRKALEPFVTWFRNLLFQHATRLSQAGSAEHDAFAQAVTAGSEALEQLTSG